MQFNSIEEAIEDIRAGKMIIVADDEDRENEGDFVMAADKIQPEDINFMLKVGRGLMCTPITESRAKELELPLMVEGNFSDIESTSFTVSVDSKKIKSGVSCNDRYLTINELANPLAKPNDLERPGHIFPLIARDGGVLVRRGHTEAAIDLVTLAGCSPVGVLCEIMSDSGDMATRDELFEIASKYNLKFVTIKDLVEYMATR